LLRAFYWEFGNRQSLSSIAKVVSAAGAHYVMRMTIIFCTALLVGYLIDQHLYDGDHTRQVFRLADKTFHIKSH